MKIRDRLQRHFAKTAALAELETDMHAREDKQCDWCRETVPPFEGVRDRNLAWCSQQCADASLSYADQAY